jgi:hypothetical protein
MLGAALTRAGRPEEALPHLVQSEKAAPKNPAGSRELALAYMHCGRLSDAKRVLDRALKRAPSNPELLLARARWGTLSGNPELARSLAIRVRRADASRPDAALALANACEQIGTERAIAEGIAAVQPLANAPELAQRTRALALFQLARLHEASGRFDRSITLLETANELVREPFDIEHMSSAVERMMHADLPELSRTSEGASPHPILIVGMPRTGSTLIERIIGAHPKACMRGETGLIHRLLYAHDSMSKVGRNFIVGTHPHRLGRTTIESVRKNYFERGDQGEVFTDKDPHNFLHLGLISKVLPEARIIRCVRDPLDTCFSCYSHHFMSGVPYAQRFKDLAAFAKLEQRVWEHWSKTLDLPMLEVRYEQLVAEPDRVEHEIIGFAGLDWHKHCSEPHRYAPASVTASTHQTRKPIYTSSVARADRFGGALDALRAHLAEPTPTPAAASKEQSIGSGWVTQMPALTVSRRR